MGEVPAQVKLTFDAMAIHVRTARLVCAAAVRRDDRSDELVQAVRLAVGEACALALRAAQPQQRLTVHLSDRAALASPDLSQDLIRIEIWPISAPESVWDPLPRTVLQQLTDSVEVRSSAAGDCLTLSWHGVPGRN